MIYLGNRWTTKAVRMIREKRSKVGSMTSNEMVFSSAIQKGSPRRMLD